MITESQAFLIQEICNIQLESLMDLLVKVKLKPDTIELLGNFGLDRKDFDQGLTHLMDKYKKLKDSPDNFYSLDPENLIIALVILTHLKEEYGHKYPKAISNLSRKIDTMIDVNEFQN